MNLWLLWEIGVNFVETYFIFYLYRKQLGVSAKKKYWVWVGVCLMVAFISILNYINIQMVWKLPNGFEFYFPRILLVITNIIVTFLIFNGSISRKILFALIPTGVSIAADSITSLFASMLTNIDLNKATQFGTERFPLTILYLLSSVILYFIIANLHFGKIKTSSFRLPAYLQIFLFAIILMGIIGIDQLISITFFIADTPDVNLNNQAIFVNILFLVILFSIIVLIEHIGKLTQKNLEYELELQRQSLEENYYTHLEETMEAIKDARHDMHNNIQIMQGLLANKNYTELKNYLNELFEMHTEEFDIVLTSDTTLNALLSSKLYMAKAENIALNYKLHDVSLPEQEHIDICSILGNLLDNAIEGCKTLPDSTERYIKLSMKNKKCMLHINIENTFDGIYKKTGNHFVSRKESNLHGRGLNSIQKIVSKRHGHMIISPDNCRFIVDILLPM